MVPRISNTEYPTQMRQVPIVFKEEATMIIKSIYALSAAIALAGATAAAAAPANTKNSAERAHARAAFAQVVPAGHTVVVDGKVVGRDPDNNVRLQLLRNSGSWNR